VEAGEIDSWFRDPRDETCARPVTSRWAPRTGRLSGLYFAIPLSATANMQKIKLREQFKDHRLPTA
jgi:hypothetical protein